MREVEQGRAPFKIVTYSNLKGDMPFLHYSLRQRAIAWISMNLFDIASYKVRNGLLKGLKRKGGLGWVPAYLYHRFPTAEENFWFGMNLTGMTVYDIGAFQGLLTLFFSSRAKAVVSFEPNARNHSRLIENLALNGVHNVEVRKLGVGSRCETRRMVASPLTLGGASMDEAIINELLRTKLPVLAENVSVVTLDDDVAQSSLPAPDLIKLDVEGLELEALRGARNILRLYKPQLVIEMHGETLDQKQRKVNEIVTFLWQARYRHIRHIESGTMITPENSAVAIEGHLYCETT